MLKFLVLGSLRGGNQGIFGRNKRRPAAAFELKSNPNFTIRKFAGERCFRSIRKIGKISFLRAGSATPFKSTDTSRRYNRTIYISIKRVPASPSSPRPCSPFEEKRIEMERKRSQPKMFTLPVNVSNRPRTRRAMRQ